MTLPLLVLAVLAAFGGAINLPFTESSKLLEKWLEPVVGMHDLGVKGPGLIALAAVAVLCGLVGIGAAFVVYVRHQLDPAKIELEPFAKGWWIDSTYARIVGGPGTKAFDAIAWFDKNVIDGAVNGIAGLVATSSGELSRTQTGKVRNYAIGIASGAVVLLAYVIVRMSI